MPVQLITALDPRVLSGELGSHRTRVFNGILEEPFPETYETLEWGGRISLMMTASTFRVPDEKIFSSFARAVMDSSRDGIVVFDSGGHLMFVNDQARETVDRLLATCPPTAEAVLPELAKRGGLLRPIRIDGHSVGEAIFLPATDNPTTLAQRERDSILATLEANGWKLVDSARQLGISRTTLWRRLRIYGLQKRNQ